MRSIDASSSIEVDGLFLKVEFRIRLFDCLLHQNLVAEAIHLIESNDVGRHQASLVPALLIELYWRHARTLYKYHFFGYDGYRATLVESIRKYLSAYSQSTRILGVWHPTTACIGLSLHISLNEQLDWSLDDMPAEFEDAVRNFGGKTFAESASAVVREQRGSGFLHLGY